MESKAIPTVEEYFNKRFFEKHGIIHSAVLEAMNEPEAEYYDSVEMAEFTQIAAHEYAVLFAKYHVRLALEAAVDCADCCYDATIDEDSIKNAYSEDNIK